MKTTIELYTIEEIFQFHDEIFVAHTAGNLAPLGRIKFSEGIMVWLDSPYPAANANLLFFSRVGDYKANAK